ncbi:hypothetical protein FEM48_Zijuj01G0059500 [Ziziphus jujuba var. spinosa]|uniref:Probable purine permease n=1 Tax=Ziziphus jujuba var. spinosa TaxID=714518 RepID=A0A978VZI7_ZIZJJ|nr:hypothetical protein FEM48_Zijuj01G0059500 [Ziziphus jujuba var. spinosa]
MGKAQDLQLHMVTDQEAIKGSSNSMESKGATHQSTFSQPRSFQWWLRMAIYTLFVLFGQSSAMLLVRLYYSKGGKSKWIATLMQVIGFPILIPYYLIIPSKNGLNNKDSSQPSVLVLAMIYFAFGLLLAAQSLLYSIGLLHLPVSIFSLICVSQLAFNALFSFLLNSQKFTPYIINCLVLLTVSSCLLVFHTNMVNLNGISKDMYTIGFLCTLGASAGYGFLLSLTQFTFQRVLKTETFRVVLEMIIYQSLVASCATLFGLFFGGEWNNLKREMEEFGLGRLNYFITLVCTAMGWQISIVGAIGLIFEVSALFSNVIGVLVLPFIPVLALLFFNDEIDGIQVIAMVLAIWGFASYLYQHYVDNASELKIENKHVKEVSLIPLLKEVKALEQ